MGDDEAPGGVALGGLLALAVSLLLAPLRDVLGVANVALLLTLVVICAAAVGGRRAGLLTALVAALGFNALHTSPYMTLRIDRGEDVVTFVLMLVVGAAVGQLAQVAADRGRGAVRNRLGIRHLHELSDLAQHQVPAELLIDRACRYLTSQLRLHSCRFVWGDTTRVVPDLDHRGVIDGPLRHTAEGFELPAAGVALPVTSADGHVVGRFVLDPSPGRGVALVDRELAVLVVEIVTPALASKERTT